MYKKCMLHIMQIVLTVSTIVSLDIKTPESSEDYLRKVMIELQELKTSSELSHPIYSAMNFPAGKRLSASNSNFLPTAIYDKDVPKRTEFMDMAAATHPQQYHDNQLSPPIVVAEPSKIMDEPVGFTKNQLASMYKEASQSGSTLSLSTLKDALDTGLFPSINGNQLQVPVSHQQLYMYHFYPLRSFMDKLQDNHGHKNINNLISQSPGKYSESNKQMIINPLFMAVSSFIGMALVFMFGVIFLPKVFGEFKSRVVHDEFLNLTQAVTEAIDTYNSTTMRPKTRLGGAVVGIKTKPVQGIDGTTRRRRKTQRPGEKTT